MVSYAIDIVNPRVQAAMYEMGINKSELMIKLPDDFYSPKISPKIQELRFQYYQKQLNSLVSEIREFVKSNPTLKRYPQVPDLQKEKSNFKSKFSETCELNFKQKSFLLTTLSPSTTTKSSKKANHIQSAHEFIEPEQTNSIGNKFKEFEEKQKLKLKQIKESEKIMQKTQSERLFKSLKDHEIREHLINEEKRKENWEKNWLSRCRQEIIQEKLAKESEEFEELIQKKLENFEMKFKKSEEKYQESLKRKTQNAQRVRTSPERISENLKKIQKNNELAQVTKLYDKQVYASQIRANKEELSKQEKASYKEIIEKYREKAFENIKKTEAQLMEYSAKLEKRILKSQALVQQNKEKMMREIEYKQELQRLKMQEKEMILKRAKRKMENKVFKTIGKQLRSSQRIEEIKMYKEKEAEKKRDLAIKMMIQKEKTREAIWLVSRSPKCRIAQEKLKEWNLVKGPLTPEATIYNLSN